MSLRESLWVNYPVDVDRYLEILKTEFETKDHPGEPEAFLVGNPLLPFYHPRLIDRRLAVTGFNYLPLPVELIHALILHPELAPLTTLVSWTSEQDLIARGTLRGLAIRLKLSLTTPLKPNASTR